MAKKSTKFDFEKALGELESLVEKMEGGELTLEDSLQYFERGIALTRACQKALTDAEQKVRILTEKDGDTDLISFSPDTDIEKG